MNNLRVGPFVRAIRPDSVAIWSEWSYACEVTLTAALDRQGQEQGMATAYTRTVTVGGRHYALCCLTGLQPGSWYTYRISEIGQDADPTSFTEENIIQCFRTLDLPGAGRALRLAYGSCRKSSDAGPDALNALGSWLVQSIDARESAWPHMLLLVGDQIYADDRVGRRKQAPLQRTQALRVPGAQTFEDFARMYTEAWGGSEGIRQVFAVLPTYTIFDDHEITNGWNTTPMWRAHALQRGMEHMLVDGLVAYWVYQGWGNIGLSGEDEHELLAIMQQAAQHGEDALEALRTRIRRAVYQEAALQWHYDIPTMPPIFVADVRADRPALLDVVGSTDDATRIMSREQMAQLRAWMRDHDASTAVLVSSVPAILPPVIGFAEYVAGVRPFQGVSVGLLRRFGQMLTGPQQKLVQRMSFDHWPVFGATWRELVELLDARRSDLVILSGDVHFSYNMSARRAFRKRRAVLYQLVSTPFKNTLEQRDKRLVRGQAWMKRAIYGGLRTRVLPLMQAKSGKRVPSDMLFQNVVALVAFWPQVRDGGGYDIRQVYLGVQGETLVEVAVCNVNYGI